jgi:hypothetical protein
MSDSSQGSGWWQGTDGKWYPPVAPMASGPVGGIGVVAFVLIGIGVVLLVVSAILWTSSTSSAGGYDCGSVVSPVSRDGISFEAFFREIECKDALGSRRSTTIIFALSGVVAFGLAALAGWTARDATRPKLKTDSQNNQ